MPKKKKKNKSRVSSGVGGGDGAAEKRGDKDRANKASKPFAAAFRAFEKLREEWTKDDTTAAVLVDRAENVMAVVEALKKEKLERNDDQDGSSVLRNFEGLVPRLIGKEALAMEKVLRGLRVVVGQMSDTVREMQTLLCGVEEKAAASGDDALQARQLLTRLAAFEYRALLKELVEMYQREQWRKEDLLATLIGSVAAIPSTVEDAFNAAAASLGAPATRGLRARCDYRAVSTAQWQSRIKEARVQTVLLQVASSVN